MKRGIGLLTTALLLTALAQLALPLPATDPLRGTLVLLPLIITALGGIGIWARERGGVSTPHRVVTAESISLVLLVLAILGRDHLGFRSGIVLDRCLAGGLVLLLAHRLGWLVAGLRSAIGPELPRLPPTHFFALPFVVYLAILPWTALQRPPDGDAPHYLLLTHSLAYDFDTDLTNNYERGDSRRFMDGLLEPQPGDPEGTEGQIYSRHNLLLPLVLAPFYRVGGLFGALMVMAALTSLTCWLTLALAAIYHRDRPREAVIAWSILAFTAPFIIFSYQVWVEIPAALLVVLALLPISRMRTGQEITWQGWLGLMLAVLALPLLKIRFLLIAAPLAVLAVWSGDGRWRRRSVSLLLLLTVLTVSILWFNQLAFQNPLKYHDIDGLRTYLKPARDYLRGLVGLFFDCGFGLFAYGPIWLLLIPAALLSLRRRHRLLVDLLVVFLPYLLVLAPRGEWFGAWSPPYRYGVVALPLLTLMLIPLLSERLRGNGARILAALAIVTLIFTTLWLVVPGWTFNLAHGRNHLLDQMSTQIGADVARFFPSSIRLRAATFLWPPLALVAVGIGWFVGRKTSARRAVAWGTLCTLLVPAITVWGARERATRVIEFEDPWIEATGGKPYPDRWVIYRPRYRGGWILPAGEGIEVPVVSGGTSLDIEIDLFLRPRQERCATIEILNAAGEVVAHTDTTVFGEWLTLSLQQIPWTQSGPLRIVLRGPRAGASRFCRATLDRARLNWN